MRSRQRGALRATNRGSEVNSGRDLRQSGLFRGEVVTQAGIAIRDPEWPADDADVDHVRAS